MEKKNICFEVLGYLNFSDFPRFEFTNEIGYMQMRSSALYVECCK